MHHLSEFVSRLQSSGNKRYALHGLIGALVVVGGVLLYHSLVYAATYTFTQSSWSGGIDAVSVATHASNQTNWTKYNSASTTISAGSSVTLGTASYTFTDDTTTSVSPSGGPTTSGGDFDSGTNSSTAVSGGSVVLSGGAAAKDTRTDYTVGNTPFDAAFDPSTNSVWVTSSADNTVKKLNASTGAVIGTYSVGTYPVGVVYDSSTGSVWIANASSNNVTKLSAANGSLIGTYSVGTAPYSIAFDSSTNSIWTGNYGSNNVTKLNASTGALIGTYTVGTSPLGIAFDSSTNSIWTANYGTSNATKLNASTGALIGTYAVGTNPRNLTFDSASNSIWVANLSSNNVTKLNASTGALVGTYAAGSTPRDAAFDSSTNSVWVANDVSNDVYKYNASTGALIGIFAAGAGAYGVEFDSYTNSIWVANSGTNTVSKLSAASGSGIVNYSTGGAEIPVEDSIAFDSSTGSIWATGGNGANDVVKFNASTGAIVGTYTVGTRPQGVAFDSSTNSIWVANYTSNNVTKLNASTGAVVGTYAVGTNPQSVVFESFTNSVWIANYTSGTITKLTASNGALVGTYTVPNPRDIIFDSSTSSIWIVKDGYDTIVKLNASTGAVIGTYSPAASSHHGMAFDPVTNSVWVSNYALGSISKMNASTGALIGTYALGASINSPKGVVFDSLTNSIWVANQANNNVTKLNPSTGAVIGTYAITGTNPFAIAFDSSTDSIWTANKNSTNVTKIPISTTVYLASGTFTSAVIDLGAPAVTFGTLSWSATLNSQTITLKARSSATADFSGATAWASCSNITSGAALSTGGCVTNGHQYIQYQATLSTANTAVTPTLDSVALAYTQYAALGALISSVYDTGDGHNLIARLTWVDAATSTNNTVRFRVRSSADGATWSAWCGYADCSGTSYFTDATGNGQDLANDHPLRSGNDDRYVQYQAFLASDATATPSLTSVSVKYVINAAPDFDATYGTNGVDVSQDATASSPTWGKVNITYKVRDTDTNSGTINAGKILPSFEYSTNNGSTWTAIPSGDLQASDSTLKDVDTCAGGANCTSYTTYTAVWTASSTVPSTFSANAKVRVTANDNEAANNTAQATSAAFTLDTLGPVVTASIDASVGPATATTTLSVTDGSQSQYRFCNDASFPATDSQGNSCAWSTLGGNLTNSLIDWIPLRDAYNDEPVYLQVRDAYGNTTVSSIVAPATPANFDMRDISNPDIGVYKKFLSWSVFAATTSKAFSSYKVYNSTNGTDYSLLTTISDSATNYYVHAISANASTTTEYYKVLAVSTQGNVSAYTAVLSGIPNVQEALDVTAPVIATNSIVFTSVKNTSAHVTFTTTDPSLAAELTQATVRYRVDPSGSWSTVSDTSYSSAHDILIQGLTPNTTYDAQVKGVDVSGNDSGWIPLDNSKTFTTAGGPVITKTPDTVGYTTATIKWNTSTSSDSYVYYSTSQDMTGVLTAGSATKVSCTLGVCAHAVDLTALTADTTYYYYVQSTDYDGNSADTNGLNESFSTTHDVTPPVVSNISEPVLSPTSAVIVWQTDKLSTSQVSWGTESGALTRTTVADPVLTAYHVVVLSSATNDMTGSAQALTATTPYYFTVTSVDASGNATTSPEQTFTTPAVGETQIITVTQFIAQSTGTGTAAATTPPTISSDAVGDIGAFDAKIQVTTDKDTTTFVSYGETSSYGSIEGYDQLTSSKTITLPRLKEGTTYHYRVKVTDKYGNTTTGSDQTFSTKFVAETLDNLTSLEKASDIQGKIEQLIQSSLPSLAPPFITKPVVSSTTEDSAIVSWTTNIKALGSIRYAADAAYKSKNDYVTEVSEGQDQTTAHAVTLTSLEPNTLYHVQARSYVFPQVVGTSPDLTFSTKAAPITVNVVSVKNNGFTIAWQTSGLTSSIVEYRNTKTGESNLVTDDTKRSYHDVQVQNLPPGVSYLVSVSGIGENGNRIDSGAPITITTSVDVTPPVISNFKVDNALVPGRAGFIQTVVSWQTDKPANSTVFYEEGAASASSGKELANKVETLDTFTTAHIMIVANLKAGTVYSLKVVSTDQSGNTKTFGPTSIITPQQTQSVLDIIVKNFEDTFQFLGAKQ
jgi:DNA-binding beta-propeller fold protein YncE